MVGAKLVSQGRYVPIQMAEVAVSRMLLGEIQRADRRTAAAATSSAGGEVRLDEDEIEIPEAESAGVTSFVAKQPR